MVRPERIALHRQKPATPALPARVQDVTFLGNNTHVQALTGGGEALAVRIPFGHRSADGLAHGQDVWLSWEPGAARAFCRDAAHLDA